MSTSCIILAVALCLAPARGQSLRPPLFERFESVTVPDLPPGWLTSSNRSPGGDFLTTTTAVYADTAAVLSTNATVEQWLATPAIDFSSLAAESLSFFERRSGTHNAGLLLEASTDGGETFPIGLGDTLRNTGTTAYARRGMKLPRVLDGQPAVRLRFRVAGDGSGTTGTIRFDNILVTALAQLDAALERITTTPAIPNAGDSVTVTATVANAGLQPLGPFTVDFYADRNANGAAEADERFATESAGAILQPLERVAINARAGGFSPGRTLLFAAVTASGDQSQSNDTVTSFLTVGLPRHAVVVNEVMYAPPSGEPEWFEITNAAAGPLLLKGWRVSNRTTTTRYLLTGQERLLAPSGYAVFTKDTALFRLAHPAIDTGITPAPGLPTFLFNNAGDAVVLFDSAGAVIDTVHYTPAWGGDEGRSLERVEPTGSSLEPLNWGSCEDSSGSTPAEQNSLTPLDTNLQLRSITAELRPDRSATLVARVRNAGRTAAEGFSVTFWRDADRSGSPEAGEEITEAVVAGILPAGDSAVATGLWSPAPAGLQPLAGRIVYAPDMRPGDNFAAAEVAIPFGPASVVINEIMFDPLSGNAEYVELYNRSQTDCDLLRWRLTDRPAEHHGVLTEASLVLRPGDFLLVAGDSSIFREFSDLDPGRVVVPSASPALNNSGDDVVLVDLTGATVDSLHYLPSWHNPLVDDPAGRSLERISSELPSTDPRNWGTCADRRGGTPAQANSLRTPIASAGTTLSCSPNPFSPDGDGSDDVTVIAYQLHTPQALVRLRIFDRAGRLVRQLADGEPSGAEGRIIWDGMTDRRDKALIGVYILLLEASDGSGREVENVKGVVVVAGIL